MKLKREETARGFARIEFEDLYGQECSLQDSSLATAPAVWFGVDWALGTVSGEKKPGRGGELQHVSARMHLTIPMAKKLVAELQRFIETGSVEKTKGGG